MKEDTQYPLSFSKQILLYKESIYDGIDFKLSCAVVVFLIYLFSSGELNDSALTSLISSLFPVLIGVLATIVAFSFAGLIFFISFRTDDTSIHPLRQNYLFPYYLFLFHWLTIIGICGIIFSSATIICLWLNGDMFLPFLFIASIYFISYTLFSVISTFSIMSKFGQIRFYTYVGRDTGNNNENKERQNASNSMPRSQSESTSTTGASANRNFRTSKDNTSTMNLERHKLLRRT